MRFNPPPGWPLPADFTPEPGWQPDPSWPPPPPGWQLWVDDGQPAASGGPAPYGMGQPPAHPSFPGQYAAGPPYPGAQQTTSGWAAASLVLGVLGSIPLSVIFGIVALRRIRERGQKGRGMAIAGLVLSGVWLVLAVGIIGITAVTTATRSSSTGQVTRQGQLPIYSLKVGDCFDNPTTATNVHSVTATLCAQPHNAQVYSEFLLKGSNFSYPGLSKVIRLAQDGCNDRIGTIDKAKTNNSMTVHIIFPPEAAWISGRRTVTCLVFDQAGNMTSSVLKP